MLAPITQIGRTCHPHVIASQAVVRRAMHHPVFTVDLLFKERAVLVRRRDDDAFTFERLPIGCAHHADAMAVLRYRGVEQVETALDLRHTAVLNAE